MKKIKFQIYFISVYLFFAPFVYLALHHLCCNNSVSADVTCFSSTGRAIEAKTAQPVVPMEIGDKWYFEKRYQYRVYGQPSVDDYTPCVFSVIDTTRINKQKVFLVERQEIPSYIKSRETWHSDSLVFTRNGSLYFSRKQHKDTTWSVSGGGTFGIRIKADTILGSVCTTQTTWLRYWHAGTGLDRSYTVGENIGIVSIIDLEQTPNYNNRIETNYQLVKAPHLSPGKPLNCFILKMQKTQSDLKITWNKSLEDNISHYRIFANNKLIDSTASSLDTIRVLHLKPEYEQLIGVAAVNNANTMSKYHSQKLSDFAMGPAAFDLVSPSRAYQKIKVSADSTISFSWEASKGSNDEMVTYNLHIYCDNFDSTITGISTNEVNIRWRWLENMQYTWSVDATDGLLLTSSLKKNPFQIFYAVFESPRIYPNPFHSAANIFFRLTTDGHVTLTIYNSKGQKIFDLFEGMQSLGPHIITWPCLDNSWNHVASGVYFLVFIYNGKRYVQKMLLLK